MLVAVLLLALGPVEIASATVFASQKAALAEAFPEATRIERETYVLKAADVERIEEIARAKIESRIVVLHTAYKEDVVLGYAHIDVHNVRTQPEALLVVLDASGMVRSVRILAFHEPLDYLPADRWYSQFEGQTGREPLRVGRDVHGVVGATLSARAAADSVRRMFAYREVLVSPAEAPSTSSD